MTNLNKEFKELQESFAAIDQILQASGKQLGIEIKLIEIKPMEFRMEPDNHKNPHLHVSYGIHKHAASYSLKDGTRIVGKLSNKYDKIATKWILNNNTKLMQIWSDLKNGNQQGYETLIKSLN